jgi:Transcriptional regulators
VTSIEEVARRAGVSPATVSRALSGRGPVSSATRDRVRVIARELGYVVSSSASALASGRMRNVGIVLPFLNRWFYGAVVSGASSALLEQGYDLTLYNLGGGDEERRGVFEHFLLRKRVDAVLTVSLELTADEVRRLHDLRKPVIGVGGPVPGVRTLSVDEVGLSRLATAHLVSLGHTRLAHVGGGHSPELDFHLPSARRRGFEEALHEVGAPVRPEWELKSDFTIPGGYAAARQLLEGADRPTGIVAASDEMAIGAILAARDLGLDVPRDVSVVGLDDHSLADFFGLTTVAQYPDRQGRMAVEVLLREIDPRHPVPAPIDTALPFDLVVRSSTSAPRR